MTKGKGLLKEYNDYLETGRPFIIHAGKVCGRGAKEW